MKPRMHADLIKAWADGATIQMEVPTTAGAVVRKEWVDQLIPYWDDKYPLRVKPREFPKSGLTFSEAYAVMWPGAPVHNQIYYAPRFQALADAAVKRYILDQEAGK